MAISGPYSHFLFLGSENTTLFLLVYTAQPSPTSLTSLDIPFLYIYSHKFGCMLFNFKCILYSVLPLSLFLFPTMEIPFILSIISQAKGDTNIYPLPCLFQTHVPNPKSGCFCLYTVLGLKHGTLKPKLPAFPEARCRRRASDWCPVATVLSRPRTEV